MRPEELQVLRLGPSLSEASWLTVLRWQTPYRRFLLTANKAEGKQYTNKRHRHNQHDPDQLIHLTRSGRLKGKRRSRVSLCWKHQASGPCSQWALHSPAENQELTDAYIGNALIRDVRHFCTSLTETRTAYSWWEPLPRHFNAGPCLLPHKDDALTVGYTHSSLPPCLHLIKWKNLMDRRGVEKNIFTKWNLNKVKNQTRAHGRKAAKCHVLKTEGSRRHLMFLLPISFKVLPKPQPLGQKWAKSPLTGTMSHRRNNQAKESQASQLKHRPEDMVTKTCIWGFAFALWCQYLEQE